MKKTLLKYNVAALTLHESKNSGGLTILYFFNFGESQEFERKKKKKKI